MTWASVNCSNTTLLEQENDAMNHTSSDDNITATFNTTTGAIHPSFYVGSEYIANNTCPVLNTYVNNVSQSNEFFEMALYDGTNHLYATILEPDQGGFDGKSYDFQMIVPEIGLPSFTGATAYDVYVELGS